MIVFCVLISLVACAASQRVESIQNPIAKSGCNVVNVHFGERDEENSNLRGEPGPPGKRGPVGPVGLKGVQGAKGIKGEKGSMHDLAVLKREITSFLSVTSCSQLKEIHGISTAGYYFIRDEDSQTSSPVYRYCNFRIFEGASNCSQLRTLYGMTTTGFYLMRENQTHSVSPMYRYCDFNIYRDIFTCHQLSVRYKVSVTGFYTVGSDEENFQIYCNFSTGEAVTEVTHDSMGEIKASKCEAKFCYSRIPVYQISMEKIAKIASHSQLCRQYLKYRCRGSILKDYAKWISRGGQAMTYWGDVPSRRSGYCACGETGTCIDNSHKCNCDQNAGDVMTLDEGYLTDKSKLPVREMRFGDMGDSGENGWHTLGKLECRG